MSFTVVSEQFCLIYPGFAFWTAATPHDFSPPPPRNALRLQGSVCVSVRARVYVRAGAVCGAEAARASEAAAIEASFRERTGARNQVLSPRCCTVVTLMVRTSRMFLYRLFKT